MLRRTGAVRRRGGGACAAAGLRGCDPCARPAGRSARNDAATLERATEGDLVGVLEVPADGQARGEAGDADLEGGEQA